MGRRRKYELPEIAKKFQRVESYTFPDGNVINRGDIIKIKGKNSFGVGEWGLVFKFHSFVTNVNTGAEWIECFEMFRGKAGVMRAFYPDRIKRIPAKRRKRVSRTTDS